MIHVFQNPLIEAALLEGLTRLLARCPTASDRKCAIMAMHDYGALSDAETGALVTALMLETD